MTIQPTEAPTIDLELLVGEMPDVACDHPDHESDPEAHEGDATHYSQGRCVGCGYTGSVTPLCHKFVAYAMSHLLQCPKCGHAQPGVRALKVLGPVK